MRGRSEHQCQRDAAAQAWEGWVSQEEQTKNGKGWGGQGSLGSQSRARNACLAGKNHVSPPAEMSRAQSPARNSGVVTRKESRALYPWARARSPRTQSPRRRVCFSLAFQPACLCVSLSFRKGDQARKLTLSVLLHLSLPTLPLPSTWNSLCTCLYGKEDLT